MSDIARFSVGELIHHRLFDYRGVIYDVDPEFMLSEDWYVVAGLPSENTASEPVEEDKPTAE